MRRIVKPRTVFRYIKLDEDGTGVVFETDQSKTTTPTLTLDTFRRPRKLRSGLINRVHYRLNPTNAVTFTLRIYGAAEADDYLSNSWLLYESPAAQVDDEDYDRAELNVPFRLGTLELMYYTIDWSGVPGVTSGFICVEGEALEV